MDGSIRFSTKLDNTQLYKDAEKLKKDKRLDISDNIKKVDDRISALSKRITKMFASVLIFRALTEAIQTFKDMLESATEQDTELQNQLAYLKQQLYTIAQFVIELAIPILKQIIPVISELAKKTLEFLSAFTGKKVSDIKKTAQATAELAKQNNKAMASFDEIHQLNKNQTEDFQQIFEMEEQSSELLNIFKQFEDEIMFIGTALGLWSISNKFLGGLNKVSLAIAGITAGVIVFWELAKEFGLDGKLKDDISELTTDFNNLIQAFKDGDEEAKKISFGNMVEDFGKTMSDILEVVNQTFNAIFGDDNAIIKGIEEVFSDGLGAVGAMIRGDVSIEDGFKYLFAKLLKFLVSQLQMIVDLFVGKYSLFALFDKLGINKAIFGVDLAWNVDDIFEQLYNITDAIADRIAPETSSYLNKTSGAESNSTTAVNVTLQLDKEVLGKTTFDLVTARGAQVGEALR